MSQRLTVSIIEVRHQQKGWWVDATRPYASRAQRTPRAQRPRTSRDQGTVASVARRKAWTPETLSLYKHNHPVMARPVRSLALLVLMTAAAALLLLGSGDADAQLNTILVDLDDLTKNQEAAPTATENDILEFEGCLTLEKAFWTPGSQVVIEMRIDMTGVEEVWRYSIDPPTHTFTASETQAFTATVTVPAGLPATKSVGDAGFALEFTATPPDNLVLPEITTDVARVTIAQYYRFSRFFSTEQIKVTQGDSTEFNFTIENTGNGKDTFVFEVTNEAEMLFAGITVAPINSKVLSSGADANVKVYLAADSDAKTDIFKLNLTIKSEGSVQDPNYEEPVTSGIEWNLVVEPSLQSTLIDYLPFIVPGLIIVIVIVVVIVILRRRKRAKEEEEEPEEEEPPPKRKRKKRPPAEVAEDADED